MPNDIIEHDAGNSTALAPTTSADFLTMIAAAAKDPAIDAGKMRELATLAIDLQKHEMEMDKIRRQEEFNRDLNAAIDEMPVITKAGRIVIPGKNGEPDRVQGTYAKFEDLNRIVKPILSRHHLTIAFVPSGSDTRVGVAPVIRHSNGTVKEYDPLPLPLETSGSKNNVQGVGSSISYGKRYSMCAVLNITVESEDDDGRGGKVTLPEERGNLVLEEAQAAADDGNYEAWFKAQSPKDRGWLVTNGYHARFGGAAPAALTGPANRDSPAARERGAGQGRPETAPAPDKPASDAGDTSPSDEEKAATEWVESYIAKVQAATSLDAYAVITDKAGAHRKRIKDAYPDLWSKILRAEGATYDHLAENNNDPATGASDLFGGGDGD